MRLLQWTCVVLGVLCLWFAVCVAQERYTTLPEVFTVEIKDQHSVGMQFFEIRFSDGGAATIAIDSDVAFYKTLRDAKGKQRLTLEPLTLQEIER
jgi:hypothetical protein